MSLAVASAVINTATPAIAADWIEYRTGPFHIFSNAGDRAARERLTELEQLRHVLGVLLGKYGFAKDGSARELSSVWPIHLVLFANQREYAPHALPKPLVEGGGSSLAAWTADSAGKNSSALLPFDLLRAITQTLIEDNSGRMEDDIEIALGDLLSTIEVNATHVKIGAPLPPGELRGERLRAWAKLQMLSTQPAYTGKLRIYLNNLQNAADEDTASRNAFDTNAAKLNAEVDAYVRAGKFEAAPVSGEALNPNRDFIEKNIDKATVDALMAELMSAGKSFPPESPRGLLAKNTRPSLELAIRANPRWAEPHVRMVALETSPAAKIAQWKLAASLAPRNAGYWQTLAEAQAAANLFADAEKSWTAAERAAPNAAERARIHQAKLKLEDQRAAALISDRRRAQEEEAQDLQRLKDGAAAQVHAAEDAANQRLRASRGNDAAPVNPIPLSSLAGDIVGEKVSGSLVRVECLKGPLRLTIQRDGSPSAQSIRLLIRDPKKLTVALDSGEAVFTCGVQKPLRKIEIQHNGKGDAKLGTSGDIMVVNFPETSSPEPVPDSKQLEPAVKIPR